jgi:hypothetical protein
MRESVNHWTPIPGPAGQLFHADSQQKIEGKDRELVLPVPSHGRL